MYIVVRHTIEALPAGQCGPEFWTVIFLFCPKRNPLVSKTRFVLLNVFLNLALLVCINTSGAQSAFGQTAARPAPIPTPAPADIHARVTLKPVDSSVRDDPSVDKMLEPYH